MTIETFKEKLTAESYADTVDVLSYIREFQTVTKALAVL